MRVLESPVTWIALAVVLVLIAALLFLVAAVRRRRARRAAAAAAWPPPAIAPDCEERSGGSPLPPAPGDAAGTSSAEVSVEPDTAPVDVDAVRARLAAEGALPAAGAGGPGSTEDAVAGEARRPRHAAADEADETDETEENGEPPGPDAASTSGPLSADEAAKDRLLAVLLRDPRGAVAALTAPDGGATPAATALLRAGLSPAQVAQLVGVDEDRLATVVAEGLGLLAGAQGGGVTTGVNRTDDPGRSWANTASSAGSTTPTTG